MSSHGREQLCPFKPQLTLSVLSHVDLRYRKPCAGREATYFYVFRKTVYVGCCRNVNLRNFFYFMELSVTNAHVLYAARCGRSRRPMTLHEFHVKLVSKMCRKRLEHNDSSSSEEEDAPPPKASTYDPPNRLRGGFKFHHISTLPPTANKKYPQRVCRLCSKNGIRRDTRFYCKDCKVALCNRPCFGDYHSKKHL